MPSVLSSETVVVNAGWGACAHFGMYVADRVEDGVLLRCPTCGREETVISVEVGRVEVNDVVPVVTRL